MQVSTATRGIALVVVSAAIWLSHGHRFAQAQVEAQAQQSPPPARTAVSLPDETKSAVSRGLAAVARSAAAYPRHRSCFSCHHQTLPMLAQVTALAHGFTIDNDQLQAQRQLTLASFGKQVADLNEGKRIGGRAMTVAYGLWALKLGAGVGDAKVVDATSKATADETAADSTSVAMVEYLLKTQRDEGHWTGQMCRPPLEESYQTCTVLAVQGLGKFASEAQRPAVAAAIAKAKSWLTTAPAKSQEDRAARLWGLSLLKVAPDEIAAAREAVIKAQRPDGGWAQLDEMDSDAYATGQTLYVLQATGLDPNQECYERGVRFLIRSQREDGNWLVDSRSKPIQPYFASDDEDPLGKDQFISIAATSWATAALAASVNEGAASSDTSNK